MSAESGQVDAKRVRRRTFLIDRKFQLKYTFIIVLVGVIVSALLGYFVYQKSLENSELIGMDPDMMSQVQQFDTQVLLYLAGFVILMALALFIWGIFITHRVAGPIFIISRYLGQIRDGQVPEPRPLRKGDELKDFFDVFSGMLSSLKQRNAEEAEFLSSLAGQLKESGGEKATAAAHSLEELATAKKSWGNPKDQ
jgi:methyl-accepting chemotaxis protein